MKKSKKLSAGILFFLCVSLLAGCGKTNPAPGNQEGGRLQTDAGREKKQIVCTIFPIYDWVREILGDEISDYELILLMGNGGDLHNYQPTVTDMAKIAGCDLFVYVGGESDVWAEDALKQKNNPNRRELALLDVLGDRVVEEADGHHHGADDHETDEHEADEHVWLSLKNAEILVKEIERELLFLEEDEEGTSGLQSGSSVSRNTEAYLKKLRSLDAEYEAAVQAGSQNTLLFCDRFPFRYLTEDYGLNYYAAFNGCSTDTDASFETIASLSDKIDELGLHSVLVLENSDAKVAKTAVLNTKEKDQEILRIDSMQSAGEDRLKQGISYLSVMEENLAVLKKALQ